MDVDGATEVLTGEGPSDGAAAPPPPVPLPDAPYDGGIVALVNSSNWSETRYPPERRRMIIRDEGFTRVSLVDLGNRANDWWRRAEGPFARGLQLIGDNHVLGGRSDGYEAFDLTTGAIVKTVSGFANTMAAYRTASGETMLTQSGTTLTFLDADDQVKHQISYPGHSFVRLARPTRNGTFLIPSDAELFEGDAQGHELWTTTDANWLHIYEPLLMSSGDVLLSTFYGASLDVVDKSTHAVTRRYGTKQLSVPAMIRPAFFASVQILPNGNFVVANWQGHGEAAGPGVQVLEFDPSGSLTWFWKQDPGIIDILEVMVIDGLDPRYLHAQEISPDSTWQPVIPPP